MFARAIGISFGAWVAVYLVQFAFVFAANRFGFTGNLTSNLILAFQALADGIAQAFAIQLAIAVLWRRSGKCGAFDFHYPLQLMLGGAFAVTQAIPFIFALFGSWLGISTYASNSATMTFPIFLSMLAVVPAYLVSFYALRPLIDAQFSAKQLSVNEDDQESKLTRPRGWTIVGLMGMTGCFALITLASIQMWQMMEGFMQPISSFGNPAILEAFKVVLQLLSALFVVAIAAILFVVPRQNETRRKSMARKLVGVACSVMFIYLIISVCFNNIFNGHSPLSFPDIYTLAYYVGNFSGITVANIWFFRCWKRAGYDLFFATNTRLPLRGCSAW